MKREQEGLLMLLKEIDALCKEHDLTYYVSGGTVIGAVRHEGFIPWDDDVDVYMTRENWNKFREICKHELPERRVLECWENNKGFNNLLGRYMNKDTTQIYKYQIYSDAAKGQVIDFFVLDPMINDKQEIDQYRRDVMMVSDLVNEYSIYSHRSAYCDDYAILQERAEKEGQEAVIWEAFKRFEKYTEEEADCYILRWGGIPHVFPKEMFGEPKYLKFEDMEVPAPTKVCDYLTQLYGLDWMYIPPHNEMLVHNSLFDFDQPYEVYDEIISPKISNEKTREFIIGRKKVQFSNLRFVHGVNMERCVKEGKFVKRKINRQIKERNIDVQEALRTRNFDSIEPIVRTYITMQTKGTFIGNGLPGGFYEKTHPVFVDIGDDLFTIALRIMIRDNRGSKALRLVEIREEEVTRPISEELAKVKFLLESLRNIQDLMEFGKLTEAEELADTIIEIENNKEACKHKLLLMQHRFGSSSAEEFTAFLDHCIELWPSEGDFRRFKGDACMEKGDVSGALEHYTFCLENSKNGLFALHIGKQISDHKSELVQFLRDRLHAEEKALNLSDQWSMVNPDYRAIRQEHTESNYSIKYPSRRSVMEWETIYPGDRDLVELIVESNLIISRAEDISPFGSVFTRTLLRQHEDAADIICQKYAPVLGWTEDQVKAVLIDMRIKQIEERDYPPFEDDSDISRFLNAVSKMRKGSVREAYQEYFKLKDSADPYVVSEISRIISIDIKRYTNNKKKYSDKFLEEDFKLRYSGFTGEQYNDLVAKSIEEIKEYDDYVFDNPSGIEMDVEEDIHIQEDEEFEEKTVLSLEEFEKINPKFILFKELVDICNQNHIEYFVGGGILYFLINENLVMPEDFGDFEIVTDGVNAAKLIEICKKLPANRTLENALTNNKIRSLDMFYTNTESTGIDFNSIERRQSMGIAIPIRVAIPQQNNVLKQKTSAKMEKLWRINYGYHFRIPQLTTKEKKSYEPFYRLTGNGDRVTRQLFKSHLKLAIQNDTKRIRVYNRNTLRAHKPEIWSEREETTLFGMKIYVPGNIKSYLRISYGSMDRLYADNTMILDPTYVDHEYERMLYEDDSFWKDLLLRKRHMLSNKVRTREYYDNWEMAKDIFNGIKLEQRYLEDMDRWRTLSAKGEYTELLLKLRGYKRVAKIKDLYGVNIDSELEALYRDAIANTEDMN